MRKSRSATDSLIGRNSAGRANALPAKPHNVRDAYRDVDRACIVFFKSRRMPCGGFADYAMRFGAGENPEATATSQPTS